MQNKLIVYLLSYKRPDYIIESIDSILAQDYDSFDVIVSENSPDDSMVKFLQSQPQYKNLNIVKRSPNFPSLPHINHLLNECKKYEYAMLFHDDDALLPQALTKMMKQITANPDLAAVACNALVVRNRTLTDNLFIPNLKKDLLINSQSQMIKRYLFRSLCHAPFPAYIYRTAKLGDNILDSKDGGKHSDTSFLVKLLKNGNILWLAEPLMKYRYHATNDSALVNLQEVFSLCWFYARTCPQLTPFALMYLAKSSLKRFLQILKIM